MIPDAQCVDGITRAIRWAKEAGIPVVNAGDGRKPDGMSEADAFRLLRAPADGVYTFAMHAESGSELRVAGDVVIDSRRANSSNAVTGMVALRRGWHPIRLRFIEYGYHDGLALAWSGPGVKKARIAPDQLGHLPE